MQRTRRILLHLTRCAGVMLALLACGRFLRAQEPAPNDRVLISDVIIRGNYLMSTEQIKAQLRTRVGDEFNSAKIQEDVDRLYKTHRFSNIQILKEDDGPDRVKVFFLVRELQNKVQKITFRGAKHIKEEELRNLTGIMPDNPLNPSQNLRACRLIEDKYEELGRPLAHCTLVKGGQLGDTEVLFDITEGPKVKVKDIHFIGNTFVSGPRLATQIHSSHQWFGFIGGTYNKQMAESDVGELLKYFRKFGYLDAKVSLEKQRSSDGREVTLIFHIQEGQRYTLKEVPDVVGPTSLPREQLQALSSLRGGDYVDQFKMQGDIQRITNWYGYNGQAVQVQDRFVYLPDTPGVVAVNYEVIEHPPARVGNIYIVGNTRTRQNVILRQVPLFPGQILTYPDIELAKNNLRRLNIFTSGQDGPPPNVSVINPDDESVFKDIRVDVNEANTGSLIFGVGVNSNSGLTGSIVLNERNFDLFNPPTSLQDFLNGQAFRGAGQEFRLQAMPGTQVQQYSFTFREPYLFDTPNSLIESAYFFTRYYNEYYEQREGDRLTLGRQLDRFWNVSLGTRIENVAVHNVPVQAPIDYQSVVGNNFQYGFRAGVMRDSRDNFIRPTSGSQISLSYEQMLGEFTFPLVNLSANKYFTVWQRPDGSGRQVLVYIGQAGWAGSNTPVYERFFAGGFTTIRGFQFRGVGPDVNGFKIGGDFMLLNTLEYQVPVKADDSIFLVAFADSGTVSQRINTFDTYRVSAGFGIRFVIPMLGPVPIALDFGFPIHKAPGDITQVFNFWMGFTR